MADEYDLRNDIDNLTTKVDELDDELKKCVRFSDENSNLQELDDNSLDYILNEYQDNSGGSDSDLEDYVTEEELDTALSTKQDTLVSGSNIATINNQSLLNGGNIDVSGGGGGSLNPELVYTCSNFNSTYINTSATNRLQLYKSGSIYFLRYFISTKTLTSASTEYLINNDTISSEYRPSGNVTFHISTSSNHNAKLVINTSGQVRISADADNTSISFAGSQIYWWAESVPPSVALSLSDSSVTYGTGVTLSATVTQGGSPIQGGTVTFYDGATSIGTATTDSSGVATLTKSDFDAGSHTLTAIYESVNSTSASLTVSKATPTISLSSSSASATYGTSITLSGTLSVGSGISIKLYDGNTLIDTLTTGSGGAFSYSSSSIGVGNHSYTAIFEGDSNYEDVTSSSVSVTINKITSTISLSSSSASATYGTSVTLSGTLSVGSGKTVKLYDGATLVSTLTTTTNGAFSYTSSGIGVGSHSYTATYDGDTTHTSVTSSSVSVTITKITSTITLSAVSSSILIGDSPQLTGTLSLGSGETVLITDGEVAITEVTTTSGGAFSYTGSATSTTGTLTYQAVYEGDATHTDAESSVVSITVTALTPVVSSVGLTSDKTVLSHYASESATLSATVLDANSSPISGATVEFFNGSSSMGTSTTNSSGVATKSYSSTGAGDISVSATCDSVDSSSITIEDCIYAELEQIDKTRSGTTVYEALNDDVLTNLPSLYSLSFELKTSTRPASSNEQRVYWCPTNLWTGNSQPSNAVLCGFHYYSGNTRFHFGKRLNGTTSVIDNISASTNTWVAMEIQKVNTSGRWDFYLNGTYKDYYTVSMENYSQFRLYEIIWSDTTLSVRNVKIKAL